MVPNNGGTPQEANKEGGEIQTSSSAIIIAKADSGVLGSQPDVYNMDNDMLVPQLPLLFNDGNEDTQTWTYNKDEGQEYFPTSGAVHESFFNQDHPLCAPDPKGCEGRFLRWFDLGEMPEPFTDIRVYLAKLHLGKLKRPWINTKVSYIDVPIVAGNLVKIPLMPARGSHVYTLLLAPQGEAMAPAMVEMNLDDPAVFSQFEKMAVSSWPVSRGIFVKDPKPMVLQVLPQSILETDITKVRLPVRPGGSK